MRAAAPGERERLGRRVARPAAVAAQLDDVAVLVAGVGRREVQVDRGAVGAGRAGSAAGSVAEALTTSRSPGWQVVGEVEEARVDERAAGRGDHQLDLVADGGRGGGLEAGGEVERERGHAGTSSRAW